MTLEGDTFTGDDTENVKKISDYSDNENDDDDTKGLVEHDRIGERPEELDLKRGQYVFLTSRVVIIIIVINISIMVTQHILTVTQSNSHHTHL